MCIRGPNKNKEGGAIISRSATAPKDIFKVNFSNFDFFLDCIINFRNIGIAV